MEKILKVTYPTITSWTWHANLFAIIETIPEAQDWIYSNYIQVHCHPDSRRRGLFFEFMPSYYSILSCPILHNQYVDRNFIVGKWTEWKTFLIDCIDNDYYIYCVCNEKYMLPEKNVYYHELFIYGYDLYEQVFYCADFTFSNSGKYSFAKVPFEKVCHGLADVSANDDYFLQHEGGILLSRVSKSQGKEYKIDIKHLKRTFKEYLEGKNSLMHFSLFFNPVESSKDNKGKGYHYFGSKFYDALIQYLMEELEEKSGYIDLRPFHNMYEHKKLMAKRIEYFEEKQLFCQKISIAPFLELTKKSEFLSNLVIKYNVSNNPMLVKKILGYIYEIRKDEEKELTKVLYSL